MKISSPHFFKKIVLVYGACTHGHVYIHAATPVCGGQMSIRSLLFSTLSFSFLSSIEFKAHESVKLPGYWAPRIIKSSLPSTGIIGMCHHAHFRKLKCLRERKTFYKETSSYVFIRYILIVLLSTKQLIWLTMKKYTMLYIREPLSFPLFQTIQLWMILVEVVIFETGSL